MTDTNHLLDSEMGNMLSVIPLSWELGLGDNLMICVKTAYNAITMHNKTQIFRTETWVNYDCKL